MLMDINVHMCAPVQHVPAEILLSNHQNDRLLSATQRNRKFLFNMVIEKTLSQMNVDMNFSV